MFPNFEAEKARKGLTLEKISAEMEKRGCGRTVTTLSQKLNGQYPITLNEAKALKAIVGTDLPIEVLFEEAV